MTIPNTLRGHFRAVAISCIVCLFPFLTGINAQPDEFSISKIQEDLSLNNFLSVLELDADTVDLATVGSQAWANEFIPYNQFIEKYLPAVSNNRVLLDPDKVYWWRIKIKNELDQPIQDWVLHTGRSNYTEVYFINEEGQLDETKHTGWLMPTKNKDFVTGNRQAERVAFNLEEGASVTLYGKVWNVNNKEPYLRLHLDREDYYKNWRFIKKTRLEWTSIGSLLTFILFNILLFVSTRDKVFFWHSLYLAAIFLYLLEFFNVLPDMVWWRDHRIASQVFIYLTLCLMDVAYLQFIRTFMDMKKSHPIWDRRIGWFVGVRIAYAIGVIGFFLFSLNMKTSDDLTALFLVVEYLLMIALLVWLFGWKNKQSRFLIAGTAVFVVAIVVNALSVVKGTGLIFSYTQFGVMGEVILFTLGLGYRMKRLILEERETQRLKDLDDFKSKFYTNITHEFRTPLTVIMGLSRPAHSSEKDDSVANDKSTQKVIYRNAQQLLRLINRLLDLSKLQSGKMPLNMSKGDMAGYLRYLLESFHSLAAAKDIHIRMLCSLNEFEMDFDSEKMQDVMTNLISNAVKFSPHGTDILVEMKPLPSENDSEGMLSISVKDSGAGISEEALPFIFDRFTSAKDTGNPAGGSGVGLALTKELVELMGGEISVQSKVGEGAEFTILLPVTRNALAAEPKLIDVNEGMGFDDKTEEIIQEASLAIDEKPLCLVIDDNADIVRYLQNLLDGRYQVSVAFDGKRGIEKALELLPDVIVSDVMMPEKDGLEVCDFLKNDERTSHIPIVLLTAKSTIQDRLEGLRRGADAYLQKPFNHEELFVSLKTSLDLRGRLRERFSALNQKNEDVVPAAESDILIEDAFIQKARKKVEEHLSDDEFDIHRLCRHLGMSRAQLHRKLTALTGKSASHFIRSIRLVKAKELLLATGLTISEIAYEVGFRDPNYFSRTYAEEFGETPSETRK